MSKAPSGRSQTVEQVVLLDAAHHPIGTAPKATVHTTETPLHLAFSCWILDDDGRVLLTRRALGKKTWPGVWTNSFCGHPAPGEAFPEAITRRAAQELGMRITELTEVLPEFSYRAVDASGIVENEFCPVWIARAASSPEPQPSEIAEITWSDAGDLLTAARGLPRVFSPWLVEEIAEPRLQTALGITGG
ncbi:isopentenyl-diphosphate Delta-isomerase [Kocuria sp. JC486]|uniref:Isopentenyl-diphosphate Delta-isomerase n=1 Tax=Kocuria soli TaxID=2485125 RepID=A0A3N3ZX57_9MICC|nr:MULTISPECIES: isopentenyl-diphosphate Delta-isomerase [Kocuria]NHU86323.1 isopentenyl-diphosphate Delta-isomerase [Kocuria sp. JC486]ROZ65692.1 isopentenyl-diphosphate Delta-isomerase [Kocuria soli]